MHRVKLTYERDTIFLAAVNDCVTADLVYVPSSDHVLSTQSVDLPDGGGVRRLVAVYDHKTHTSCHLEVPTTEPVWRRLQIHIERERPALLSEAHQDSNLVGCCLPVSTCRRQRPLLCDRITVRDLSLCHQPVGASDSSRVTA